MREIEIQTFGRVLIPDNWTDGDVKKHIKELTAQPPANAKAEAPKQYLGVVTLDWSQDETSPIVRGDIANLTPLLEKHCKMKWEGDWWHVEPRDRETIVAMCEQLSYQLVEVLPKSSAATPAGRPCPPAGPPTAQGKERKEPKTSAPAVELPPVGEPGWVTGIIEKVEGRGKGYEKNSDKKTRVSINLKIGKATFSMATFDTALFPPLLAGKGKEAVLVIQRRQKDDTTYINIVGLRRIGTTEYDEDGKTPMIQNATREAGGKTLF